MITKNNKVDILLSNTQGLNQYKIDKLVLDYCKYDLNFFCITETWLLNHDVSNFNFSGYHLISSYGRIIFKEVVLQFGQKTT